MAYVQSSPLPTSTFNNGSSQLALNKSLLHKSNSLVATIPNLAELDGSPSQADNHTHLSFPHKQHNQNLYPPHSHLSDHYYSCFPMCT